MKSVGFWPAFSLPALVLLLTFSCAALWVGKATALKNTSTELLSDLPGTIEDHLIAGIPLGLRTLSAGFCMEQAELYLHQNPVRSPALLAWLKASLLFAPQQIEQWETLGRENLFHFGDFRQGIRHLQEGILKNRSSHRQHELWATAGVGCWFHAKRAEASGSLRLAGIRYLERAVAEAQKAGTIGVSREGMNPQSYAVFQARLHAERGDFENALECWRQAGAEDDSESELGLVFSDWVRGMASDTLMERVIRLGQAEATVGKPSTEFGGFVGEADCDDKTGHKECGHSHQRVSSETNPVFLHGSGLSSNPTFLSVRACFRLWSGPVLLAVGLMLALLFRKSF